MKIVVLDGHTLNPGDLDWRPLEVLGTCTIFERTCGEELLQRCAGAEIVLTNKTPLTAAHLGQLPALRYIGVLATGYNVVDLAAAKTRGIVVTNVPAYGTASVAQHVFALLLELAGRTGLHADSVRAGEWCRSADWCYWKAPLTGLEGLTLGLVGYGRIGARVARIAQAFDLKVIAATRTPKAAEGVTFTDLDTVLRTSDVISLHCPLTPATEAMIDRERLGRMKPGAFLINTSRGSLIAEADLAAALNAGRIAGAALDVLSSEPPSADNPLLTARNCLITPHLAWATQAARRRLLDVAVKNLAAFLSGTSQNTVG